MDWCDACKYNPPDYSSHEPDKPCGDCWVYGEGNKPSKFAETENRQTNADLIRSMTDEELADYLRYHSDMYARYDMDWLDWLKEEVSE